MKKLLLILAIFVLTSTAYADKTITFNGYDPISVTGRVQSMDYGSEGAPDVKTTVIIRCAIREKQADGTLGDVHIKKWDIRADNPNGLPKLPAACRSADRIACDKWLYSQTANEAIAVDTQPVIE